MLAADFNEIGLRFFLLLTYSYVWPGIVAHRRLLSDARGAQSLHYWVRQRKYFEPSEKCGVVMAYRRDRIAQKIECDLVGCQKKIEVPGAQGR